VSEAASSAEGGPATPGVGSGLGLFDLTGKVALLTGATRGIGLAMARQFLAAGATLVISSNEPEACAQVARQLSAEHGASRRVLGVPCDVAVRAELKALVAAALAAFGRIDVLCCNAGIAPHAGPLHTASDQDWDRTMTVNLRSMLWLTSLVVPGMAERGDGAVILTASLAALRGNKRIGLYGLAKAGCAQLARNLAVEWGPRNVRVNAISPGVIDTEFALPISADPAALQRRLAATPLRRLGHPDEVAGVALLLASRAGGFITGQNIVVDGGTLISDGN
jgi:NAD(P)-dependent dehydrogenase (short-subunit alcohol dehydrogenase family)